MACDVGISADEDAVRSPLEMEADASTASSCSAVAGANGDTGVSCPVQCNYDAPKKLLRSTIVEPR